MDRLTPPQLRDLADVVDPPDQMILSGSDVHCQIVANRIRREAARREAEANELGRAVDSPSASTIAIGEREGPGSAAAPKSQEDEWAETFERVADEHFAALNSKPAPAAADMEEDAVDHMPAALRAIAPSVRGIGNQMIISGAADRIEAQAREIAELKDEVATARQTLAAFAVATGRSKTDGFDCDWFELGNEAVDLIASEKARAHRLAAALRGMITGYQEGTPSKFIPQAMAALSPEGGDRG